MEKDNNKLHIMLGFNVSSYNSFILSFKEFYTVLEILSNAQMVDLNWQHEINEIVKVDSNTFGVQVISENELKIQLTKLAIKD